jgi:ribosomal protein S18 acetylase RimI-like enzyme
VLRWVGEEDVELVRDASPLFDHDARVEWTREFLGRDGHHLCLAYEDGVAAGFVSGLEMTHPDKGTEMFLYELGVDERFRGRGIGRSLVAALAELARARGCYGMWVLTDRTNTAALATYTSAGAVDEGDQVMLGWQFSAGRDDDG